MKSKCTAFLWLLIFALFTGCGASEKQAVNVPGADIETSITAPEFKRLVSWKATAYISDGITAEEYEARMAFVRSTFDLAVNELFVNTDGITCEVTYDYAQPPAVFVLSEEPYFSLFIRKIERMFAEAEKVVQAAHAEMELWWVEYVDKNS